MINKNGDKNSLWIIKFHGKYRLKIKFYKFESINSI